MSGDGSSFGERVAAHRRLRGLTQQGLAQRMHRSASWVTKVERGERRVDSVVVLAELARALGVSVDALLEPAPTRRVTGDESRLAALRRMLDDSTRQRLGGGEPVGIAVPVLVDHVRALRRSYTAGHDPAGVTAGLLRVVADIESTALVMPSDLRVVRVRADALRLGSLVLRQLGDLTTARIAVDRAMTSAEQSGDVRLVASVAATMSVQLMMQGRGEAAVSLALDAARFLTRTGRREAPDLAIRSALFLSAAQSAARAHDQTESRQLLATAQTDADDLRVDGEYYCLIAGPTNAAIQRVGILVDLARPDEAVRVGSELRPQQLGSANRTGYHYLHMAHAHAMTGHERASLDALLLAHRGSPDLIRHDPQARDLVAAMVRRRRVIDDRLRRLALAMHVTEASC